MFSTISFLITFPVTCQITELLTFKLRSWLILN